MSHILRNETETERSGVRSSLGSQCCVLEQDWIGVNTFFMILIRVNKGLSTHLGIGIGGEAVADPEGFQGVRSHPPHELNYFIFMGNFRKK